ncbi:MAG: hypothetical protein ACU0A6_03625 [Shimia sp.]|uniref:hypothetical protein n=1 Tax=Shimia sp. TaxID=1954381 RepID=UPI0040593171
MADGDIWISAILGNSDLIVGTEIDREESAWQAIVQNREVSAEHLPVRVYGAYRDQFFEEGLPDLFMGAGGVKISQDLKDILMAYDLGAVEVFQASLYLHDRKTLIASNLHLLGIRKEIEAFVPEQCQNVRARYKHRSQAKPSPEAKWKMPFTLQDGDIAVMPSRTEDLDFWSDKWLWDALFFSDPLKQALCEGGYAKLFDFKKCKKALLH